MPIQPPAGVVPFGERREYVALRLPNGARALLVHDAEATRAEAALTIGGAGQFSDPPDLPGLAHLTEHMVLAADGSLDENGDGQLESWLAARDGASNAFTALDLVCFHLSVDPACLEPALERFLALFANGPPLAAEAVIRREIDRVHAELDSPPDSLRELYLVKSLAQPQHPFSRFGAGDRTTLGRLPTGEMRERVRGFFATRYMPSEMVLCVTAPAPLGALKRWVSRGLGAVSLLAPPQPAAKWPLLLAFPPASLGGREFLVAPQDQGAPAPPARLTVWWPLQIEGGKGTAVTFVLAQLLAASAPASLRAALAARGWLAASGGAGPRVSLAVDVPGLQLVQLSVLLSEKGLRERSAVVRAIQTAAALLGAHGGPSRALLAECASIALIHSWALAPRPPDALELAVDGQHGDGLGAVHVTGAGSLVPPGAPPLLRDGRVLDRSRTAVASALLTMAEPQSAIVLVSARAFARQVTDTEPALGARYTARPLAAHGPIRAGEAAALGLALPVRNPLVPLRLRPPRTVVVLPPRTGAGRASDAAGARPRLWALEQTGGAARLAAGPGARRTGVRWRELLLPQADALAGVAAGASADEASGAQGPIPLRAPNGGDGRSAVYLIPRSARNGGEVGPVRLPLPRAPRASAQSALVVQLLTERPAEASARGAAHGALWLLGLHERLGALAELGASAGLKYELSFNAHGMRIAFTGLSQSLPEYTRRFAAVLSAHAAGAGAPRRAAALPVRAAVAQLERAPAPAWSSGWQVRREGVRAALSAARPADVRAEGAALWASVRGTLTVAQGDLLPAEALALADDFSTRAGVPSGGGSPPSAWPSVRSVLYPPRWLPARTGDACLLPGIQLVADACGRVPR